MTNLPDSVLLARYERYMFEFSKHNEEHRQEYIDAVTPIIKELWDRNGGWNA